MELLAIKFVTPLLLPPGANIVLALAGLGLLAAGRRRLGASALAVSVVALYLLATSAVSGTLLHDLEVHPAVGEKELKEFGAGAVVVLGGGRYAPAPEYDGETVSRSSLARVRYGARVQRLTGLPLAVTGGVVFGPGIPEAALMAQALEDFGVQPRWVEGESRTTAENALRTREMLAADGIGRIVLVTDAYHMPRAVESFRRAGFEVLPAPTYLHIPDGHTGVFDWLPTAGALSQSSAALHERLGRLWYQLRY